MSELLKSIATKEDVLGRLRVFVQIFGKITNLHFDGWYSLR